MVSILFYVITLVLMSWCGTYNLAGAQHTGGEDKM